MTGMTRGERQELGVLIRARERVMKSHARERSAVLMAEFDAASAKIHSYDDDPVWADAQREAETAVVAAKEVIAARCAALGIPREFAPTLEIGWFGRGQNAVAERRAELRRAARSRVQAVELEAITRIERMSLQAQMEIVATGLQSEAARAFLNSMPAMETLMPPIEIGEIQALVETKRNRARQRYLQ